MRIALVVPGGVDRTGTYRVIPAILALLERLARRHQVHVFALSQEPEAGSWDLLGARVHNLGCRLRRHRAVRYLVAWHRRVGFDLFHSIWAGWPGYVAFAAGRLCRRPVLVHLAGGELVWLPDLAFGNRSPWHRGFTRFVLRHADRVTAASSPMLHLAEAAGARPVRVTLGVNLSQWVPSAPRPRPKDRPAQLVHVGSLTPVKDHSTLLHAAAILARDGCDFQLHVVGEDTSGGTVQRLALALGLADRTRFHGFLPQHDLVPLVTRADLMIVSSRHEAGPVAMLEAAAVGVPTVGTAVGHVRDLAPHAAAAVPVGDAPALAREIRALLADDDRRLALARRAQEFAVSEDADWTAMQFERLYAEVAPAGRQAAGHV